MFVYCLRHREVMSYSRYFDNNLSPRANLRAELKNLDTRYGSRYASSVEVFAARHRCCELQQCSGDRKDNPPFMNYKSGHFEYKDGWRCFGEEFVNGWWERGRCITACMRKKSPTHRRRSARVASTPKAVRTNYSNVPAISYKTLLYETAYLPITCGSGWY